MSKANAPEMAKSRIEMLQQYLLDLEPKELIGNVARKFNVKYETIRRDWSKRKKWMGNILTEEASRALFLTSLSRFDINSEEIDHLYEQETILKAKRHLLSLRVQIDKEKREFLKYLGAFEVIKADFKNNALKHQRRHFEEEFPWTKGNKDIFNSALALSKTKGLLSIEELVEFEKIFDSMLKGKDFVKTPLALLRLKRSFRNPRSNKSFYPRRHARYLT